MLVASIADVLIEFSGFSGKEIAFEKFVVPINDTCVARIILDRSQSPGFARHFGVRFFCADEDLFIDEKNGSYALVNQDNSKVIICMPSERNDSISEITAALMCVCLTKYDVLMVHASLVDVDGEGILFIGQSGIGKTTQAEQWQKYRNADIINGDHVFIREREDGFWGHGSPWHGSSPYCENKKTKLRAIVALKQSAENRLTLLSGLDAIMEVENSVYLPKWRREEMEHALSVFDDLLNQVPVYQLECRVDEEAVDIVYRAVFSDTGD